MMAISTASLKMQDLSSLLFPYFLLLDLWLKVFFISRKTRNGNPSFWNQAEKPVQQGKGTLVPRSQGELCTHSSSVSRAVSVFQELLLVLSVSQA